MSCHVYGTSTEKASKNIEKLELKNSLVALLQLVLNQKFVM